MKAGLPARGVMPDQAYLSGFVARQILDDTVR